MIKGIRTIKCRLLEETYAEKIEKVRVAELNSFSIYCHIKNICSALYFNAGIVISAMVFILVDK